MKRREGKHRTKDLTWYHLCTTRNQAWALLMPRTGVRLVVPWPLHCSWTLWWWEGLQEGNIWSPDMLPGGMKQQNYLSLAFSCNLYWPVEGHGRCLLGHKLRPAPLENTWSLNSPSYTVLASLCTHASVQQHWRKFCHKCIGIHRQLRLMMDFCNLWIFTCGSLVHMGSSERRRWEKDYIKGKGRQQKE